MSIATNDRLILQASRSDATAYVDLGNAAARKLDAAFVRNVPPMTEGTYRGRSDALRSAISDLEERMGMGTATEIESAIRVLLGRIDNLTEFLAAKSAAKPTPAKITATDATARACRCDADGCS